MLLGMTGRRLRTVVFGRAGMFVLTSRLYHHINQRLLGIDVAFHSFPR